MNGVEVKVVREFTYAGKVYCPGERVVLPRIVAERAVKYGCVEQVEVQPPLAVSDGWAPKLEISVASSGRNESVELGAGLPAGETDKKAVTFEATKPPTEASIAPLLHTELEPNQEEIEVDPRLMSWLQHRGFRKSEGKPVWVKHDKVDGRIVRFVVDFQRDRWGSRFAYVLDEQTGEWKHSDELRDVEELLSFKKFRDELRKAEEQRFTMKTAESVRTTEVSPGVLAAEKDHQIVVMVEEKDERQILEEMMGTVLREYVYQIPGQRPRLSYLGVKEAARLRGNIHITKIELEETKDGSAIIAKAEVYDLQNNFKIWGVAVQRKRIRLRDGREIDDDFCLTKAVSKAIRNGLRACIPEKLAAELVSRWLETQKGEGEGIGAEA